MINIEFKAKANNIEALEAKLLTLQPQFIGEDHQVDTYYHVNVGRLKLREGNIENALIWYDRQNTADAKLSKILLYQHTPSADLKAILEKVHGVKVVVDKKRKIYFIDNIKFHFDRVAGIGTFVEVEAIDRAETFGIDYLNKQCNQFIDFFNIQPTDFMKQSYSDMMLAKL